GMDRRAPRYARNADVDPPRRRRHHHHLLRTRGRPSDRIVTLWILAGIVGFLAVVALYDVAQTRHAVIRNFPLIGHLRYILETFGPELRQYIVTGNDEERPFSRDQRRWVYASSKNENQYFGFGTDNDLELSPNYLI